MNTRLLKQLVKLLKEDKTPRKAIGWAGGGVNEIRFLKAMSETTVSSTVQYSTQDWCGWFVLYSVELRGLYCTMWRSMTYTAHILLPYCYQQVRQSELQK